MKTDNTRLIRLVDRFGPSAVALLLFIGHFAPWAAHKTAALTLSANELAVFTHSTPGAGIFLNQWFYLPLWSAALLFALLAGMVSSRVNRLIAGLLSAGIASLGLPGYPQILTAYRSPDYRLQFYISIAVMLAALVVAITRVGLRPQVRRVATLILGFVSAVPLAGYVAVKPFIEQLYGDSLGLGSGWWLTLIAVLLAMAIAVTITLAKVAPQAGASANRASQGS